MPIHCPVPIRNLSKEDFDARDKVVMRCAYDTQNALGRLCEERVYENDLARRLRAAGFQSVHTQVPVTVTHGSFAKQYRLDVVADHALYELKVVNAFVSEHDAQVLHYAMLLPVNHGKLLNFRSPRVEGRLRFNAIMTEARHRMNVDVSGWQAIGDGCVKLKAHLLALLEDWGGFLDFRLYEEACVHHFGGEEHAIVRCPLVYEGETLGAHRFCLHDPEVCFMVSGYSDAEAQTNHLQRLLALSNFKAVQWINLHHNVVRLRTLTR
jgi:GxxExxY protein